MKTEELSRLLRAYAGILSDTKGGAAADVLALAHAFEASPATTFSTALKRLASDPHSPLWVGTDGRDGLAALRPFLAVVAKATIVKDLDALLVAITAGPTPASKTATVRRASSRKPAAAARPDLVDEYLRRLNSTLGNQAAFLDAFEQLSDDPALSVADIRDLTKKFAKVSAKSKADALKKIWARHQSLACFNAKARATDGRSAA